MLLANLPDFPRGRWTMTYDYICIHVYIFIYMCVSVCVCVCVWEREIEQLNWSFLRALGEWEWHQESTLPIMWAVCVWCYDLFVCLGFITVLCCVMMSELKKRECLKNSNGAHAFNAFNLRGKRISRVLIFWTPSKISGHR